MELDLVLLVLATAVVAVVGLVAAAAWRSSKVAAELVAELAAQRHCEAVGRVVGPARRLALELEVPSHGGLPRWGFANVDPTPEQVELFASEMAPLAEMVRHRLLECASTHPSEQVRTAAAVVAVRANTTWTSTLARLRGEVAARRGGENPAEGDRAVTMWRRFRDDLEVLAELLDADPNTRDVEVDHAHVPDPS